MRNLIGLTLATVAFSVGFTPIALASTSLITFDDVTGQLSEDPIFQGEYIFTGESGVFGGFPVGHLHFDLAGEGGYTRNVEMERIDGSFFQIVSLDFIAGTDAKMFVTNDKFDVLFKGYRSGVEVGRTGAAIPNGNQIIGGFSEWGLLDKFAISAVYGNASTEESMINNTSVHFNIDNIALVPIPATGLLLISGLIGIIGIRRRKG